MYLIFLIIRIINIRISPNENIFKITVLKVIFPQASKKLILLQILMLKNHIIGFSILM